jgi:putative FmdB family regulatory protein
VPTYEYRCKDCGNELEVVQSFTVCGGDLRKVFGNVGIAFKGSGFYKNDSRGSGKKSTAGATAEGGSSTSDSPSSDKAAGSDSGKGADTSKPAEKAAPATPSGKGDKAPATTST